MLSISHVFSHLIPITIHLRDEETEAHMGKITFPSYQLVNGRARFQTQICDQKLAGTFPSTSSGSSDSVFTHSASTVTSQNVTTVNKEN